MIEAEIPASFYEFRNFLNGACVALTGKPASTNKRPKNEPNTDAANLSFWQSTRRSDDGGCRDKAYMSAYTYVSRGSIPMLGIRLSDGQYIWPDRAVIERSLRDGIIEHNRQNNTFDVTDLGRNWLCEK